MDRKPVYLPGDQKVFRPVGDARHPHLVNFLYLILCGGAAWLGVLAIGTGEVTAGGLMILLGSTFSFFIVRHEVSEMMMVRRMRKRAQGDEK